MKYKMKIKQTLFLQMILCTTAAFITTAQAMEDDLTNHYTRVGGRSINLSSRIDTERLTYHTDQDDDLRNIGDVQSESLVVKAQQHQDPNDIISGRCPKLTQKNQSLHLITPQTIDFIEQVNVPSSLGFTAPSITTHTDFNSQKNLTLSATKKLDLKGNVSAKGDAIIQGSSIDVNGGKKWITQGAIAHYGLVEGANLNVKCKLVDCKNKIQLK